MKISIVTISFNQRKYLQECIDSILSQGYPNLEYIVVDPGSTDGSRELITSYGEKITRIFEPDTGPANGLNSGFSVAKGEIFGFVNSDDTLLPGALATVEAAFAVGAFDVVTGIGDRTNGEGKRTGRIIPSKFTPWLYVYGAVSLFQQGTFFRSSYFHEVGGFNEGNHTCWDGELFLDMALAGARFKHIHKQLATFRIHDASISGSGRLNNAYRQDSERLFAKVMTRPPRPTDALIRRFARIYKFIIDPTYVFRRFLSAPR